jgi:oligo-1,6-glucosidase
MNWWKEAVVYQIYPRSYQDSNGDGIGDLPGITSRLDYLKDLGIDVIWLSPVYESPNVDGGYDISDYRSILSDFGSMADFDEMLSQAHKRGIKIIMDLVVNHTSDRHAWFLESRNGRDSAKRDWYIWRDGSESGEPNGLSSAFSGSAWTLDERSGQYYLHLFAKEQPDLNWENEALRSAVYDMMDWWLAKGVDGFRMDVINLISKPAAALASDGGAGGECANGPMVHEYLREMNEKVLSKHDVMTVGETVGVTVEEAEKYAGFDRCELSMVFQFELMEANVCEYGKWGPQRYDLKDVKRILSKWQSALFGKAWNSLFWSNHDQPRAVSRFGDASSALFWEKSAKMLATCLHMMQGTPYIFQGEELGMTNTELPSLESVRDVESLNAYKELVTEKNVYSHEKMMEIIRKIGRDNARTPMQWDSSSNAGFTNGTPWIDVNPNYVDINARRQEQDENSILNYYRRLIRVRKGSPVVTHGDYELLLPEDDRLFAYRRRFEGATLLVICNFTAQTVDDCGCLFDGMETARILIGNYKQADACRNAIEPYEARAILAE